MITLVYLSEFLLKQIERRRIPEIIEIKILDWMKSVQKIGLEETRKIRSYHDEPLQGKLQGKRSIRLNRSWRAYYVVICEEVEFVSIERIDKHEY